ncbi:hypothetical protein MAR_035151 [Mya arenaria]|uniref:Receptor ligand binding region domain-containing protein n=1 Tax=Mya arenaria TaxID=6604 RepID=A0ABY7ELJ4_MYAAR|nr:hypothetical protein MAR_035151 [Mya arenaria]
MDVYENEAGGCGKTLPFSVQHIEAVTWQLRKLNNGVGLRVWATCGSLARARQIAYNISLQLDDAASDTLAVLGPENSEEAEVVFRLLGDLPASVRPLHISFSADGDVFTDKDAFNNFFRVIPPETATVESVAKFLSEMLWTYVAVFHDNSTQSLSRLEYLKELALEYSTQTKEYIFRSENIRQYTTNGKEHVYPDVLRPECPDGRQCTECPMRESPPIDVTEGDMYIVGIVPVHTTSGNALQCGNVKQGGVDVAESIKATVMEAKKNSSQYLKAENCYRVTPDQRCFKVETWSPFAAIGVETLLKGNSNTSTICEEYLRQPEVLMKHVLKQKFAVSGTSLKSVYNVTSHDGLIDLNTYQIKKDDKGVYYDQLEEEWAYAFRESTCDKINNPECSICFSDPTTTPSPPPADNSKQAYITATFVTASFCCMLLLVLIVTLCKVVQGRRKRAARRQTYLTPTMGDDGYLSTIDVQRRSSVGDFSGGIFNEDVNISGDSASNNTTPQGHASNTSLNNLNNSCYPPRPYIGAAQQNKYV